MKRQCSKWMSVAGVSFWGWLVSGIATGAELCPGDPPAFARIVSAQGIIELNGSPVRLNDVMNPGDSVRVGPRSRAAILICSTETVLRIDQNSELRLGPEQRERSLLELIRGAVYFFSHDPQTLEFRTPFVNAGVEGTEFYIQVDPRSALITVFQGRVQASNESGNVRLTTGQSAVAGAGDAPAQRIIARPRDAVQWALYYEPVLSISDARSIDPALAEAVEALYRGDYENAFRLLDKITDRVNGSLLGAYRAGFLLAVGSADDAIEEIGRISSTQPGFVLARALQITVAVARARKPDEKRAALDLAKQLLSNAPDSAAVLIALSYAQQSLFDLPAAKQSVERAVERDPENALAWARLAELWLALGYTEKAREAAERAAKVAPQLSRINTVRGYVLLAETRFDEAIAFFETAIRLDSGNPLPRLGRGLGVIRKGRLVAGRRDIFVAVSLDPDNSLLRSYLGKAYFEEHRSEIAAIELDQAKELDPNDPTPWLYDAIRKQLENRPVEALSDLERSIELNDNRAVYRSRLTLDEDLAARQSSLARIYRDLGFDQRGLVEGWKSVELDPSNNSGHRFLADSYSALPRHEIARDSELLQAQLLQPVNAVPVLPRLADDGLTLLTNDGLISAGFNEFTSLFLSNGLSLHADGVVGNNDTLGGTVVQSGILDDVSYSVGLLHFETEGIRENNRLKQDIGNAFIQVNTSRQTSFQFELRSVEDKQGDRRLLFDSDNFASTQLAVGDRNSARVGFRHDFSPGSTSIGSYTRNDSDSFFDTGVGFEITTDELSDFFEVRHLQDGDIFNVTVGAGYLNADTEETVEITFVPLPPSTTSSKTIHRNAYVYASINWPEPMILTLGGSHDAFDGPDFEREQFNPKFGLTWNIGRDTVFRTAAFRVVKRTLISSQTIEPTQVAGFNQFFDDVNGTKSWRYGVAIDHTLPTPKISSSPLYLGLELSERDLAVPTTFVLPQRTEDVDRKEKIGRAYAYWAPARRVAIGTEYRYERLKRDPAGANEGQLAEATTHRIPLEMRYFDPSGAFARLQTTYVDQKGQFLDDTGAIFAGSDSFWTVDASFGYRFPKRLGLFAFEIKNLLDKSFRFQDIDPTSPEIVPERQVLLRLSLAF